MPTRQQPSGKRERASALVSRQDRTSLYSGPEQPPNQEAAQGHQHILNPVAKTDPVAQNPYQRHPTHYSNDRDYQGLRRPRFLVGPGGVPLCRPLLIDLESHL